MEKNDAIYNLLCEKSDEELISIWNEYSENNGCEEDKVYENSESEINQFFGGNAFEALRAASYGNYDWDDAYFKIDGYNNLESIKDSHLTDYVDCWLLADNPEDTWFNEDELASLREDFAEFVKDEGREGKVDIEAVADWELVESDWTQLMDENPKNDIDLLGRGGWVESKTFPDYDKIDLCYLGAYVDVEDECSLWIDRAKGELWAKYNGKIYHTTI